MEHQALVQLALRMGATKATVIPQEKIVLSSEFRKICEGNGCGMYNKTWMCSTAHIGDIDTLMDKVRSYKWALWYQLIGEIEDSYDFEGMMEAGERHNKLAQKLWDFTDESGCTEALHLGAGGCRLCSVCGKKTGDPCRFPARAMGSLEAYGVNVSELAPQAGMKYINAPAPVTYFGMVLFND